MKKIIFSVIVTAAAFSSFGQKAELNWYNKSPKGDKVYGTGADKAYELLKDKKPQEVVVAVIDSGVEVDHPDLKDVIWVNADEIPGNGIDDDNNGYIDDVHGWSFLGGVSEDINHESMEIARMYHAARKKFEGVDVATLTAAEQEEYKKYQQIKADYDKEQGTLVQQYQGIKMLSDYMNNVKAVSNGEFSKKTNKAYVPKDEMEAKLQKRMKLILALVDAKELDSQVSGGADQIGNIIKYNEMNTDSIRRIIVGDDPNDLTNRIYGCNRYEGPDAMHGTHVSGIIAGVRGNGVGIDGVASNAKIMVLRAVPNGDERDKDIANSIRYAVDNGAKVINMSFGKYYTPSQGLVDEAIRYAKSKDVLLVHAAGNDAKNKDKEDSYPTRLLSDGTKATNWIEVGASSSSRKGKKLLADFSNYGSTTVDIFAPGVDIYSTVPDFKYEDASGTSMACPATAGVCALIRGYFPELSAEQVREVLMNSSVQYKKKIRIPGTKTKATMKDVAISGGFVNAEKAVQYILDQKTNSK
jgi:subtilisin family serine protease